MSKNRTWHGVDISTEISLFEYGFLLRWNSKTKMYNTIFVVGYDEDANPNAFVCDSWDADSWREELKEENYDLKGIADMCGMDKDTYLEETNDVSLLNDILAYYGFVEVIDYYSKTHTIEEIKKKLNKALY